MKRRTLLSLVLLLAIPACFTPSEPVSVTGRYALVSINGAALPFTYPNGVSVKREVIELREDNTFVDEVEHPDGTFTTHEGVYANFTGTVNMGYTALGLVYQARVDGATLRRTIGSYTEVYARQ